MGYAAAGLLGIGIGFRVGLFGLLFSSAVALVAALAAVFLRGEPVIGGIPAAALHLMIFELSALAGMAVRHGLVGGLRETPTANHENQPAQSEEAEQRPARALF